MGLAAVNRKLAVFGEFLLNWGGSIIVAVMISSIYYTCVHVVAEMMYEKDSEIEILSLVAKFIVFEIAINLLCFIYYSRLNSVTHWHRKSCVADLRSYAEENEDSEEVEFATGQPTVEHHLSYIPTNESGSKFCFTCNREAPQRSHHCPLCKMCVLRKDHHCFVTGACVGLGNQRYFMVFLFWCTVGLLVAIPHLFFYLSIQISSPWPYGFFNYLGPVAIVRWLLGYNSFYSAILSTIFSFSAAALITAGGFLGMQFYYTTQGYTMYEYHHLTVRATFSGDGETLGERFRLVFGKNWALNFLCPLPWNLPVLTPAISDSLFRVRSKVL